MSREHPVGVRRRELHALEAELLLTITTVDGPHWADHLTSTRVSSWRESDGRLPEASNAFHGAWETAVRRAHGRLAADVRSNPAQVLADELFSAGLPVGLNPGRYLRNLEDLQQRQRYLVGKTLPRQRPRPTDDGPA